jgi:DNA-binding NarL/FixJ family response regulator
MEKELGGQTMTTISILLAEDHTVVRESIRQTIEREADFKVVGEASDGEQAVLLAEELKPDIILMDISMPKLNGIEATKEIKKATPQARILILTAYDYDQYLFPLLEAGAAGYLLKDVNSHDLITAIRSVYKGDVVLHPTVARKVMLRLQRVKAENPETAGSNMLTEREATILNRAARGMTNNAIAEELNISVRTVEGSLGSIFNKLGVGSRTEAVIQAIKKGWLSLPEIA